MRLNMRQIQILKFLAALAAPAILLAAAIAAAEWAMK